MSILKRTVYYDITGGVCRFLDFAKVTTTLGSMVEPFTVQERRTNGHDIENFDFTDAISRIDTIEQIDVHKANRLLSGVEKNTIPLHGGTLNPRLGP